MSHEQKIRVAVIRGGPSSGYDESIRTGDVVLKSLPDKYEGVDVFVSNEGIWHIAGFERTPVRALEQVDVVFSALHGTYGEDGKSRAIFEAARVPFIGTPSFESAAAAHAHHAKNALTALGSRLKVAAGKLFHRGDVDRMGIEGVFREISLPSVVRPSNASLGDNGATVRTFFDLEPAVKSVLESSDGAIIEELIDGRRVSVILIEGFRGEDIYALPAIGADPAEKRELEAIARDVHRALGLRHYSECIFVIHPKRGVFYAGVRTAPTIVGTGGLAERLESVGSSLGEFLDHLIIKAVSR